MRISDWSSDVCSSDLQGPGSEDRRNAAGAGQGGRAAQVPRRDLQPRRQAARPARRPEAVLRRGAADARAQPDRRRADGNPGVRRCDRGRDQEEDRKSTRLNSVTNAHLVCRLLLEKKKKKTT